MEKINVRSSLNHKPSQNIAKMSEKTSLNILLSLAVSLVNVLSHMSPMGAAHLQYGDSHEPITSGEIGRLQSENISFFTVLYSLYYPYSPGGFPIMKILET